MRLREQPHPTGSFRGERGGFRRSLESGGAADKGAGGHLPQSGVLSPEVPPASLKPNASHSRRLADLTALLPVFSALTRQEDAFYLIG